MTKKLEDFFDIDNLYIQLYNIYTEYKAEYKIKYKNEDVASSIPGNPCIPLSFRTLPSTAKSLPAILTRCGTD